VLNGAGLVDRSGLKRPAKNFKKNYFDRLLGSKSVLHLQKLVLTAEKLVLTAGKRVLTRRFAVLKIAFPILYRPNTYGRKRTSGLEINRRCAEAFAGE
jgi:hypothetical protein